MLAGILSEIADRAASLDNPEHVVAAMLRTVDLVIDKPPNADWIVSLIGFLDPGHELFSKDYQPLAKIAAQRPALRYEFANADGFFDGLPELPRSR